MLLGCKWTVEYALSGIAGAIVATLILPGSYLTLPCCRKNDNGEIHFHLGALARIIVGGIIGCVVDCTSRNAFFGGFFSWHIARWLSEDGWKWIHRQLSEYVRPPDKK